MKFEFLKVALALPGQLTEEEEMDLLDKFQKGDTQAYKKLRISLRPLVEKAISDATPSGNEVSTSNLRYKADTEMMKILQNFDIHRGIKLKTYITSQLKGYLRNTAAENMSGPYVPRNQHTDLNRYKQAIRDAQMEHGRNATEDQIRQFYPHEEATTEFDKIKHYHVNSYMSDAVFGEDSEGDGVTFKDQFTDGMAITNDDLFDDIFAEESEQKVSQQFTETERQVIDRITKDGQPFVQVALSLGLSTSEIRKIMRRWHDLNNSEL